MVCPRCAGSTRFYATYAGNVCRKCEACGTYVLGPR